MEQETVKHVDLRQYSGAWYVIGCIPTAIDRNWDYTKEIYTLNKKGVIEIFTTFKRENGILKSITSKGFVQPGSGNAKWKVQYIWPFKAHYWIIELGDNYSYTVVGHPKNKFLYIMSRSPEMTGKQFQEIADRCKKKGL